MLMKMIPNSRKILRLLGILSTFVCLLGEPPMDSAILVATN